MRNDLRSGVKRDKGLQVRDFQVKLEAADDAGEFTGYGSIFGNVDAYNEIVAPGAFTNSIAELKESGRALPVLWNHNSNEPIGLYTSLVEDDRGLKVSGKLLIDTVARAKEVNSLMTEGVITGLSIGYWVKDETRDQETGVWTLKELKLREISLVTFPANDEARIETVKMKLAKGERLTKREFEKFLRESGFSRADATLLTAKGFNSYCDQGDPGDAEAVSNALETALARF